MSVAEPLKILSCTATNSCQEVKFNDERDVVIKDNDKNWIPIPCTLPFIICAVCEIDKVKSACVYCELSICLLGCNACYFST